MMYFLLFLGLSSVHAFRCIFPISHVERRVFDLSLTNNRQSRTRLYAKKPIGYKLPDLSQSSFPDIPSDGYFDLIVIGSGPAGESAAVRAAQLGAKVAIVEKKSTFGGPTGLTSKAVREAASRICKAVDQLGTVSGPGDRRKQIKELWKKSFPMLKTEAEVLQAKETRDRLHANKVSLFIGTVVFSSTPTDNPAHTMVRVCRPTECVEITAAHVIIAAGSRPNRPTTLPRSNVPLPFAKMRVVCATEMGGLVTLPTAVAIIGGGVIAVEYATVLAQLGVGVSLICNEREFLPCLEQELRASLRKRMQRNVLFVDESIKNIELAVDSNAVRVTLEAPTPSQNTQSNSVPSQMTQSNPAPNLLTSFTNMMTKGPTANKLPRPARVLKVDLLLFSGGRDANSDGLGLDVVQVEIGKYGRIVVDPSTFRTTSAQSIYAIGDVIGPPGLASAAQQHGRVVSERLFSYKNHDFYDEHNINIKDINDGVMTDKDKESESREEDDDYDLTEFSTDQDTFFFSDRGNPPNSIMDTTKSTADRDGHNSSDGDGTLFGAEEGSVAWDAPLTLWTLPEIASVGLTLEQANAGANTGVKHTGSENRVFVEGRGYFRDMARGRLSGDSDGYVKVLAQIQTKGRRTSHVIIGVHIIGDGANELIQLGSILVHSQATLEMVSKTPFAAVTLSGIFQMACDDALLRSPRRKIQSGLASSQIPSQI